MDIEALIFICVAVASLGYSAYRSNRDRTRIKERANREYQDEHEPTRDELESRLGEMELMYEGFEESYWFQMGVLLSFGSYLYWNLWYISAGIGVGIVWIGYKFLAVRPFTTGTPDRDVD